MLFKGGKAEEQSDLSVKNTHFKRDTILLHYMTINTKHQELYN